MSFINFDDALWGSVEGIELCDSGGPGNTLTDPTTGVSFIIAEGSMEIMDTGGADGRILFFSCVTCADAVLPTTTLVMRFDAPHEYVRFRIYPDPVGSAVMMVNFYEDFGETGLLESRAVPLAFMSTTEVIYNAPTGTKEITIRTEAAENRFFEIEFYESVAETRHDIALVLDGSGSMQNESKWESMVEAADIFHDLYKEFGHSADGFGAVRFRWDCMDAVTGDQTVSQPLLNPLSVDVDIPTLYEADEPEGCTPVGEAVVQAAAMASGGVNPAKHLLLLTDGKNNRGRSVSSASADPSLSGVTVHTLGLGSGINIDPVEISTLASSHSGTFRQTTDVSEVLDFFAQTLGDMLGNVEMAVVMGDTVVIAPGTAKAVFLTAWEDASINNDFDLITPGGVTVDHSSIPSIPGMTLTYHASTTLNAHAYFVAEGDISGSWEFSGVAVDTQRIALEDLDLKVQWSLSPQLGRIGDIITLDARVYYKGKPFTGDVTVRADVTRPYESQGHLIASELRKKPVSVKSSGDLSQRAEVITAVFGRLGRNDFMYDSTDNIVFKPIAEGHYRLEYDATEYDGIYRFDLKIEGHDEKGELIFARRTNRFSTLINDVDAAESQVEIEALKDNLYSVSVTPLSYTGAYVGPFLAEHFHIESMQAQPIGKLKDNLDGSYTQIFRSSELEPIDFSVGMFGQRVPVSALSDKSLDRLPWILVFILIVILILSFLC